MQANVALGYRADTRDYGIGLQILKDLGLSRVRLLTNNPKKTDAFVYYGYELKVVDQVPIVAPEVAERRRYLDAKRDKLGHVAPICLVLRIGPGCGALTLRPVCRQVAAATNPALRGAVAVTRLDVETLAGIQLALLLRSDHTTADHGG